MAPPFLTEPSSGVGHKIMWYNSSVMRKVSFSILTVLLLFSLCPGFTPEEVASKLETKLKSLRSFQADFEQTYYSSTVTNPLQEKGRFYLRKPDLMRWEYLDPEEKVFIYKKGIFLEYYPEDNQLIRRLLSDENYESETLSLLSGQKSLKDSYIIEFNPFPSENVDTDVWQLKLTPREEGEYAHILLEIDRDSWLIHTAIFIDWAGNKQEFHFSKLKPDVHLTQNLFELNVPPDCEIIEEDLRDKK